MDGRRIDPATVYRLAAEVPCHHRTARAYLLGRTPRTYALASRLEWAAERLGIARVTG